MRSLLTVLVIQVNEDVTVDPIRRKEDEDEEVWDKDEQVKCVGRIDAAEGLVEELAAKELDHAFLREHCRGKYQIGEKQIQTVGSAKLEERLILNDASAGRTGGLQLRK